MAEAAASQPLGPQHQPQEALSLPCRGLRSAPHLPHACAAGKPRTHLILPARRSKRRARSARSARRHPCRGPQAPSRPTRCRVAPGAPGRRGRFDPWIATAQPTPSGAALADCGLLRTPAGAAPLAPWQALAPCASAAVARPFRLRCGSPVAAAVRLYAQPNSTPLVCHPLLLCTGPPVISLKVRGLRPPLTCGGPLPLRPFQGYRGSSREMKPRLAATPKAAPPPSPGAATRARRRPAHVWEACTKPARTVCLACALSVHCNGLTCNLQPRAIELQ